MSSRTVLAVTRSSGWSGASTTAGLPLPLLLLLYNISHLSGPEWWGAGVVVCLEQGADLHMAQLMPLPLTVSCFSKIQIGFTFLVLAYLG